MQNTIEQAARKLIEKLEAIHKDKRYTSVWTMYAIHGCKYDGPTYIDEFNNLKQSLEKEDKMNEKITPATPAISLTISLNDATQLSQGSVWSEFGLLQQLEALLGKAVAQVQSTSKPAHLVLTVDDK